MHSARYAHKSIYNINVVWVKWHININMAQMNVQYTIVYDIVIVHDQFNIQIKWAYIVHYLRKWCVNFL